MSYNVRDDNATFGPNASIELPNGASASTIAKLQLMEPCGIFGATGTGGTNPNFAASTYYTVWVSPPLPSVAGGNVPLGGKVQVVGVQVFYSTAASGAATLLIENCPAGTANGSGSNILSATNYALNTALTTANTPQSLALNANVDNLQILDNSRINVYTGATATTGLVDFTVSIYLIRY